MMLALIVAATKKRVIGRNNTIPWHISEDLKLFKRTTLNATVIMGRKTYESIGRPLPQRKNIVLSKSLTQIPGVTICQNLEEALDILNDESSPVFIIGGGTLYRQALPLADKLYISWVKGDYEGDTYFPEINEQEWDVSGEEEYRDFIFTVYQRKKSCNSQEPNAG